MEPKLVSTDLTKATHQDLINEYESCMRLWGKYSCDCFGYYIQHIQDEIMKRGGFILKHTLQ